MNKLTRNVNKLHVEEIFGLYGKLKNVDLPLDRVNLLSRGLAYVEYELAEDAEKAKMFMDGGWVDGQPVSVQLVLPVKTAPARNFRPRSPMWGARRRFNNNNRPSPPRFRRSPPRFRRRAPSRSKSPPRRRKVGSRSKSQSPTTKDKRDRSRSKSRSPKEKSRSRSHSPQAKKEEGTRSKSPVQHVKEI